MKKKTHVRTETTRSFELTITPEALRGFIRSQGFEPPDNVEIGIEVPCGGNYSGCRLYIGEDVELTARWQEREVSTS